MSMRTIFAVAALAIALSGPCCARVPAAPDVSGLTEASMNFDQDGVAPFLKGLAKSLPSGFDAGQAEQLSAAIDSLPVEHEDCWEYTITFRGKPERLVVVAFKDDVDAPDLYFYASASLAAEIDRQLEAFAEARGG
jgi:hypothetical protein